ncbi:MAG: ABC transporter permease [Elusimicrobia bacterium]|nr:ABC transporter permease [Elusimicrobiota bacterium]
MPRLDPLTLKKFQRFRSIRRGWWSAIGLAVLIGLSLFAEVFVNSRALVVRYRGHWYFPTYGAFIPGRTFGLGYDYETNYRKLQEKLEAEHDGDFVILPLDPWNPYENDLRDGVYPPTPPSWKDRHYLGTDTSGRDVLARVVYGFRIAILFSLILLLCNYVVGVSVGCAMGYWGGAFDLILQRLIEVWSNVPFLYVIIIVASVMVPNFMTLILIMVFFGWMSMTWYMRTVTYKQKTREYVLAARALGATDAAIIFRHILPNTISVIVTFIPFSISGGIVALTSLDYLGFGLPPPTPSWGELLAQGTSHLDSVWIASSVIVAMIVLLTMVTFVGEAIREAFDPRRHAVYE